jgi:hypothetical protein
MVLGHVVDFIEFTPATTIPADLNTHVSRAMTELISCRDRLTVFRLLTPTPSVTQQLKIASNSQL